MELFESKSSNFKRAFGLLLGFAFIFLFVIFLPYHSIQIERADTLNAINSTREDISIINATQQNLTSIMKKIETDSPKELRSFVLEDIEEFGVRAGSSPEILLEPEEPFPSQQCSGDTNVTRWAYCEMNSKVEELQNISENINEKVIKLLQNLHNKPLLNVTTLEEQKEKLFKEDLKKLVDPKYFATVAGKFILFENLANHIEGNITAIVNFTESINTLSQSMNPVIHWGWECTSIESN